MAGQACQRFYLPYHHRGQWGTPSTGGADELGATFWGQTELSVYDDTQHGIWGMSY